MTSIRDMDTSALETAELDALKAAAARKTYAELVKTIEDIAAVQREEDKPLMALRIKLEAVKESINKRIAELAFTPSITAEGDAPLKRLHADKERLSASYQHTRQSIERNKVVQRVAREELQRRAQKRDALVTERCYAEWRKQPLEEALETARKAVVQAYLVKCGRGTTRPDGAYAFHLAETEFNGRFIQTLALKAEEEERQKQQQAVIASDKMLG